MNLSRGVCGSLEEHLETIHTILLLANLPDSAAETLVLLRIVALQANLKLYGFRKFAGLLLAALKDLFDGLSNGRRVDLAMTMTKLDILLYNFKNH